MVWGNECVVIVVWFCDYVMFVEIGGYFLLSLFVV